MEIEALRYFVEIAAGKSFEATAYEHFTSASSVSRAISKLEQELGVTLFSRARRSATLTEAGEFFYEGLKPILADLDMLVTRVGEGKGKSNLVLCGSPNFSSFNIGPILSAMSERCSIPVVRINRRRNTAVDELRRGRVDFLFTHVRPEAFSDLNIAKIKEGSLLAIVNKESEFAERESVELSELVDSDRQFIFSEMHAFYVGDYTKELMKQNASEMSPVDMYYEVNIGRANSLCFSNEMYLYNLKNCVAVPLKGFEDVPVYMLWRKQITNSGVRDMYAEFIDKLLTIVRETEGIENKIELI